MNCASDGVLRTKIDGELSGAELDEVSHHLASCAACRRRMEAVSTQASRVEQGLAALAPRVADFEVNPQAAYSRFQARIKSEAAPQMSFVQQVFAPRWRPAWGATAAACAVVAIMSFSPARTWAQHVLAMLRVQKIAVVPIDVPDISTEPNDREAGRLLSQMISDNVVTLKEPGKPQTVSGVKEAAAQAGFATRAVVNLGTAPRIMVRGEAAFQMTLNRDRLESILQAVGRSDIQLSKAIDGATVSVYIPKSVISLYGDCKNELAAQARIEQNRSATGKNLVGKRFVGEETPDNCVIFTQVPSPTVAVPPTLNIADLAEAGLQLTGMTAGEAHSFTQTVDWSSTLVIPVPRNIASYQKIPVDGVEGTLIQIAVHGNRSVSRYALIWLKNGVIYGLRGFGSSDQALLWASNLH